MKNKDILDKAINDLKSLNELQIYCDAQYKALETLRKDNKALKEECEHLKKLIADSVPVYETTSVLLNSDEEATCRKQIRMLHDRSLERELTLEEARKLEIYTKILNSPKDKQKTLDTKLKDFSDAELIKMLNEPENKTN